MAFHTEDFLGYWLFYAQRSVAYAFSEALKACCQAHDKLYAVTPPQWGVLSLLDAHEGMTIGTIGQKRGIDAPTVTGIVTRLEQHGLVERRHDRHDRRQVRVYLTDEGSDIMRYLSGAALAFSETTTQGLSEAEQRDLIAKLQQIVANLSDVGPGTGDRFGLLPQFTDKYGGIV